MPPNTIKIDRSTPWGNPFKVGEYRAHPLTGEPILVQDTKQAVRMFKSFLQTSAAAEFVEAAKVELQGKNLACWCKAGDACHGDVLLRLANRSNKSKAAA